ncbi:hypothetical protein BKA56DRAFT_592994 [Ilyonectria sp. MPI-CAGE-AT-0026]|nr:hypothetical protein BKA56DRAFT_592994 [Ilyonectria sp. MPI-CAGE-AT-0026]
MAAATTLQISPSSTPPATPQPTAVIGEPVGLFSHTGGRSDTVFYLAVIFPIVSVPIILLRLWASKFIVKKWHIDDTLTVIATTFAVLQSVAVAVEARLGAGDHIITMTPEGISLLLKIGKWAGVPLYNLTTLFIKASVLMFYLRFFVDATFRMVTYGVLFVVVAYSMVNVIATFALNCENNAACDQLFRVYITCAAVNVATDFAILLLPFWLLRPMKVPFARKVGIAVVLMGGGFVTGVSIYRLVITIRVDSEADVTYGWGESVKWSLIESWSGIICASLPCLKTVFSRYLPNFPLWRRLSDVSASLAHRRLATISGQPAPETREIPAA